MGGDPCPFCKTRILMQSQSNDLYCPGCGHVIPIPLKSSYLLEGKALARGAQIAKLVFDSFRQPLPAGIRTVGLRARQLLYQAGRFRVDLRLDAGPDGTFLVGQVMDSTRPDQRVADVPVTLLRSATNVSKTVTNMLGEFQSELEDPNKLCLWIGIDEERPIVINLQELENGNER
jgi:uncharacterized protein YbaR (Trm112 family)